MTEADAFNAVRKGLEYWTLINLTDLSIILSFLALIILAGRQFFTELEQHLKLRVTLELWRLMLDFAVDLALLGAVIIGLLIINPDIFADVKVALPFYPAATLLLAVTLVLRVFHGGRRIGTGMFRAGVILMAAAVLLHAFGYTFVMEAAPGEWLAEHPSAFWSFLSGLRSDANMGLSMIMFWIFGPLLYLVLIWGVVAGILRIPGAQKGKS